MALVKRLLTFAVIGGLVCLNSSRAVAVQSGADRRDSRASASNQTDQDCKGPILETDNRNDASSVKYDLPLKAVRSSFRFGALRQAPPTLVTLPIQVAGTMSAPSDRANRVVTKRASDSLWNGALIGAAIGGAYGVITVNVIERGGDADEPSTKAKVGIPLLSAAIGAGVGALIDSLKSSPPTRK